MTESKEYITPVTAFQIIGRNHTSFTFVPDSEYYILYNVPEENMDWIEFGRNNWFFNFIYLGKSFRISTVYPNLPCDGKMSFEIHAPVFTYLAIGPGPTAVSGPDFILDTLVFYPLVQDSIIISNFNNTEFLLPIQTDVMRLYGNYMKEQIFSGFCQHLYIYTTAEGETVEALSLFSANITINLPFVQPSETVTVNAFSENSIIVNGGYYNANDTVLIVNYKGNPDIENNIPQGIVVFNDLN